MSFARKVLPTPGLPINTRLVPLSRNDRSSRRKMRGLAWLAALVMEEVKGIDAGLRLQPRALEAAVDGALSAGFQFHVGEPVQGGRRTEVFGGSFSQSRLQLAAHGGQAQLVQFLFERSHGV